MFEPPPGYEIILRTMQRDECLESRLVLEAAGISAEAVYRDDCWLLIVNGDDLANAVAELDSYRLENPDRSTRRSQSVPVYGGAVAAVLVYAGVIILVTILSAQWALGQDWLSVGQMQAGRVVTGQWWRVVTALTLHADAGHLIGNLVFGTVFGLLAGQALGGGVAWLMIVIAGALGNLINAMVQPPTHTSIGASTAVFAALGVLVSHSLRPRESAPIGPLRRWSPLIGGLMLLAFTGVGGERTDVVAHLTGFLSGLLLGWVGSGLPGHWLASRAVQQWAGLATLATVTAAWIVGLVVSA